MINAASAWPQPWSRRVCGTTRPREATRKGGLRIQEAQAQLRLHDGRCQEPSRSQRSAWEGAPHTCHLGLRCVDRVRLVCTGRRGRDHRRAPAHARSRAPSPVKRTEQRQGVNHFMVLHLTPDDVGREERGGGRRCRQARMHFLFLGRGRLMTSEPWQCTGDERLYLLVLSRRGWQ